MLQELLMSSNYDGPKLCGTSYHSLPVARANSRDILLDLI